MHERRSRCTLYLFKCETTCGAPENQDAGSGYRPTMICPLESQSQLSLALKFIFIHPSVMYGAASGQNFISRFSLLYDSLHSVFGPLPVK